MKLMLKKVRLAFPVLFTPVEFQAGDGKPAYSCSLLLPKDSPDVKAIQEALKQVAKEKWAEKAPDIFKTMQTKDDICFRWEGNKPELSGYKDRWVLSCRNGGGANRPPMRPTVVDRDRSALTEKDGRIYSGCVVNASVDIWPSDNQFGKKLCCQIAGVQFYEDGQAFAGGAPASAQDFDDLGMDDEPVGEVSGAKAEDW